MIDATLVDPDLQGRGTLVRRGVLTLVVLLVGAAVLVAAGRGAFADTMDVTAEVADAGGSLAPGSDVKVDGIVVGTVRSLEAGDGSVRVRLRIDGDEAARIPATARARVLPATIFGTTFVDLVGPADAGGATLAPDQVVAADTSTETLELQDALDSTHRVLTAVEPAELSVTLGALAEALDGRGAELGDTLQTVGTYLERLEPRLPEVREDLRLLARTMTTLADVSPELLDATRDALVTSRTLVERRAQLTTFIAGGTALVGEARTLVGDVDQRLVDALAGSAVVVDAMHDERQGLPDSFTSFVGFAAKQAETFADGSYMSTDVFIKTGDDAPYTAADCPRYGTAVGPNCPEGGSSGGPSDGAGDGSGADVDASVVAELRRVLESFEAAGAGGDGVGALLARPYLGEGTS